MFRRFGWSSAPKLAPEERAQLIHQQSHDFEVALQAMDFVLDDKPKQGLELLQADNSIAKLAKGVIQFLEATLGFEADVIREAQKTLAEAEAHALRDKQYFQDNAIVTSRYPPGTEYTVTSCEAGLLGALLTLLSNEGGASGMIESAKALMKLRKAYQTLQEVVRMKAELGERSNHSSHSNPSDSASIVSSGSTASFVSLDASSQVYKMREARLSGAHIGNPPASSLLRARLGDPVPVGSSETSYTPLTETNKATIDEFLESGAQLCFGILQVVLSLIPPVIAAVLSVIGFKGINREDGLRSIWAAAMEDRNIHGGIALLGLLFYHDGPFTFSDVDFSLRPVVEHESKETEALNSALLKARALFPNSPLWMLLEARLLTTEQKLQPAMDLLSSGFQSNMRQVQALALFDRALLKAYTHDFVASAKDFEDMCEVNEWSHGFYMYCAGACYAEHARMIKLGMCKGDAVEFEKKSEVYYTRALELAGSKKLMSKPLPFDVYLKRKLTKRSSTSAIHEVMYFYGGYNRMDEANLRTSVKLLQVSESKDELEEDKICRLVLSAVAHRRLGELQAESDLDWCIEQLFDEVDKKCMEKMHKVLDKTQDAWVYPVALYEKSLFLYQRNGHAVNDGVKKYLEYAKILCDCDFELSTRVGMKIRAGYDRFK